MKPELEKLCMEFIEYKEEINKVFKTEFGAGKKERLMQAAMLVSTYYSPSAEGDIAAISSMISIIAVQMMILMMIIVMNSANTAAIASASH